MPLALLQLAQLAVETAERDSYLVACVQAAETQAPYWVRLTCFREASLLLAQSMREEMQALGVRCEQMVGRLEKDVEQLLKEGGMADLFALS